MSEQSRNAELAAVQFAKTGECVGPWLGSGWVCFLANGRSSMAADVMANFRVGVEKRAGESVGVKRPKAVGC